jgi:hypothetical protein
VRVLRYNQIVGAVGVVGWVLMLKSECGVRAVCDGLERCCSVSVVCSVFCGIGCVRGDMPAGNC